jgi:hypothetical protein
MPITVLNPTNLSEPRPLVVARRLETLRGALVGVLDNRKVNADRIFQQVAELLCDVHGVREVVWRRKHNFSQPAPTSLIAELSACDAIITGIGD